MNPDSVSGQVPDIADGVSESTKASTTEVQTITSRKKSNAQRCREYRERKKLQNTMAQNLTAERSDECSETDQLRAEKPKTNAERRKKHYQAQKLKKQESKKIPKTAKQRNKEYYYRKKKIRALNTLNQHSDAFPRPGKEKREEWIKFVQINRREENWKPSEDSRICSLHFKDSDKYTTKTGRTYLKRYAEPHDFPETAMPETPDAEEQAGIRRRSLLPLIKRAEEIIARVYNYLQTEYEELKSSMGPSVDLSPLANILKRTAAATGISEHTVSAILEEKKRAADEDLDAGAAKRAKLTHDAGDGDASPITEEESSCQEQEDVTEQDENNEQTQGDSLEPGEYAVETLKVEIEDETYYRPADPLQSQPSESSAAEHQLPLANIANVTIKTEPVEVKIEPVDTEYTQSSCEVVPVTSLPRVKIEPDDDPSHSSTSCASAMVSATLCDVKCEPPP